MCIIYIIDDFKLWFLHTKDPTSVHMWVNENEKIVSYYNEHGVLDLNSILNKDVPFTI